MKIQATPVFRKNNKAINALDENSDRKYRYIINQGSSRSSKTWSLNQIQFITGLSSNNKRITVWRKTKTDCRATVYKDFQNFLTNKDCYLYDYVRHNKTESTFFFDNTNSSVEFNGTDDHQKVHGLTQSIAWFNEANEVTKEVFDQIDQRTSDVIFIDWNPSTSCWINELAKHPRAIVIHSTYKENPFCPLESKLKIDSYEPTEENITNGTADNYMWQVYGLGLQAEKPNKIYHGWEKINLQEFLSLPYPTHYGLDFGLSNPTALVEVKYNDHTFYANELLYKPEKEMREGLIPELQRIGLDKTAPLICDSANPDKILELRRAGFNAMPANKGSGSVFSGISLIQRASVKYTDTSVNLENEYNNYEWDSDRLGIVDKPLKVDDHILDGKRYICSYLQVRLSIAI